MGDIKSIVEAIEGRMAVLGYTATNDVFDFESVPDSIIDKAFRIETRILENPYYSGNVANPKEEIAIWIAYKTKRNPRAVWKTALDEREAVEKDLVNAEAISSLSCDPLLEMDQEASSQKLLEDYLISKLVFSVDYIRSIAPS